MGPVEAAARRRVDRSPGGAAVLSRIVPLHDVELGQIEEGRRISAGILRPVPVGKRKIGIAAQAGADLLKEAKIVPVPVKELQLPMLAVVGVDLGLGQPVSSTAGLVHL